MPTPVGHSLAGLAVFLGSRRWFGVRAAVAVVLLVGLANLPDIDFLFGYMVGEPRAYHWGATHSIVAAVLAGLIVGVVSARSGGRFLAAFAVGSAAYGCHILLDLLLGPGALPSVGLQVFWPFSPERHMLPWNVFRMFPASIEAGPIRALFSRDALPLILREVMILTPVCLAAWAGGSVLKLLPERRVQVKDLRRATRDAS